MTAQPELTKLDKAVIRQLGGKDSAAESMPDIARHGISGGFHGFIYYTDTIAFFKRNRTEIVALVREMADNLGEEPIEMVALFNCLGGQPGRYNQFPKDRSQIKRQAMQEYGESVARCLYGGRLTDEDTNVANALSWFAAEETARKLTDE